MNMKILKILQLMLAVFHDIIKFFDKKSFNCKQTSTIKYFWRTEWLLTINNTLNLLDEVQIKAIFTETTFNIV